MSTDRTIGEVLLGRHCQKKSKELCGMRGAVNSCANQINFSSTKIPIAIPRITSGKTLRPRGQGEEPA